ncbi:MAG: hypothetical protein ABR543_02520 [Gemmatimonadaceae bacterium]
MPRSIPCTLVLSIACVLSTACSSASNVRVQAGSNPNAADDTTGEGLVPPGFGSLRQDDIAVKIQLQSVQVRAIPLDESVIRLLSPDSYRALRELQQSKQTELRSLADRYNARNPAIWYISFYALEPDARFSPMEVVLQAGGRDFRPLDLVPLTNGFGEQRIKQREVQSALYLFEDGISVDQPLTLTVEGVQNTSWSGILRSIERERAAVRSRASQSPPKR